MYGIIRKGKFNMLRAIEFKDKRFRTKEDQHWNKRTHNYIALVNMYLND